MGTLGEMIGVVGHTLAIAQFKGAEQVQLNIKVDFTHASDAEIKSWLVSNRTIAGQRPWRALSIDELKELNGRTFNASNIGQKVESREKQVQGMMASGFPRELAEFSIDNPEEFKKVMEGVKVGEEG